MTTVLSVDDLARQPAWPRERVRALPGRCRGSLLRDWGHHLRGGWGEAAVEALRRDLDLDAAQLPDAPTRKQLYPVSYQLLVTRAIADAHLGGDMLALEPLLLEAGRRVRDRVVQWAIRRIGPRYVLRQAGRIHGYLYDRGEVTAEVGRSDALLRYRGAALFDNPTYRVLQCFGLRGMITLLGRETVELSVVERGPGDFDLRVTWTR